MNDETGQAMKCRTSSASKKQLLNDYESNTAVTETRGKIDSLSCATRSAEHSGIGGGLVRPGSPAAEPPAEPASAFSADPRWNNLPHTDTEFVSRTYPTLVDWTERREHLRRQILWSAGLWPMPERTPLNARISGRIEPDDYTVEKVAFESRPGCSSPAICIGQRSRRRAAIPAC